MKKLSLCLLLASSGALFASNYVTKITGVGSGAKCETIYDPMIAEMMRSMNSSEEDDHVRQAAKQGRIITKEQARAEINAFKQQITEASAKYAQEQQRNAKEEKAKKRAADANKAFSGLKKGFL